MNGWINNRESGELRRHCAHFDVTVMCRMGQSPKSASPISQDAPFFNSDVHMYTFLLQNAALWDIYRIVGSVRSVSWFDQPTARLSSCYAGLCITWPQWETALPRTNLHECWHIILGQVNLTLRPEHKGTRVADIFKRSFLNEKYLCFVSNSNVDTKVDVDKKIKSLADGLAGIVDKPQLNQCWRNSTTPHDVTWP